MGLGDPIQVSSVHGHGTGDLLDAVFEHLPEEAEEEEGLENIRVAVIGKPNAGKSSSSTKSPERTGASFLISLELPETLSTPRLRMITAGSL